MSCSGAGLWPFQWLTYAATSRNVACGGRLPIENSMLTRVERCKTKYKECTFCFSKPRLQYIAVNMKNIFVSILAVASLALAAPLESRQESATQATDRLLFSSTISQFISARNARSPANLDWSADGCSSSPDNPLGFNFLNSCLRHDFGYRNYKAQSRFTANGKSRIDVNFRSDMYNQCNSESLTTACRAVADLYYRAVVEFGLKRAVEYQGEIKRAVIEAELEKIRLDIAEGKI